MAYDIVKSQFAPEAFVGGKTMTVADTTADTTVNLGSKTFQHVKGKLYVTAQSGTVTFRVLVDDSSDMSGAECVYVSAVMPVSNTPFTWEFKGSAQALFQYVQVDVTLQTSATFDVVVEAA